MIGNNQKSTYKKMNLFIDLIPHKVNSKRITDLNGKHKTIKILEGNIGENLGDLVLSNDFLDVTLKA